MEKYLNKWKIAVLLLVLTVATAVPNIVSEAKTINKKVTDEKTIRYVGDEIYLSDTISLKINNKSTSKFKKKIKTVKTSTHPTSFYYKTNSYFYRSSAYNEYNDYSDAVYNLRKYVAESNYTMRFLKEGTYTVSYVTYDKESLGMTYNSSKTVNGKRVSYYKLVDHDGKQSSELYEEKSTTGGDTYYQGVSSKKIYAFGCESSYVAASIRTGADKKQYVYYQPRNIIKTTHSRQYKVLKTSRVVSSVQLGKTKITRSDSNSAYSSSSSSQRSFLSGNSGKLTVKMADKNYSITSIVVLTYDKEGKEVYTKVNNKKKISYGLNKYKDSFKSSLSSYQRTSTTLYKPTTVYINYKNKFTGEFSRVNSITKNKYGNWQFSVTSRSSGDTKDTVTERYNMPSSCTVSYTFYKK